MSQFTQGKQVRLMYLENKEEDIDGHSARIGWVRFSKSGRSVHYRDRTLTRIKGGGTSGNFFCQDTGEEYWISGIKIRGSNAHWAEPVRVHIDEDALDAYEELRSRDPRS